MVTHNDEVTQCHTVVCSLDVRGLTHLRAVGLLKVSPGEEYGASPGEEYAASPGEEYRGTRRDSADRSLVGGVV